MVSRWKRDEFFTKIEDMDVAELKKTLWTVYWRGTATVRERIEELVEPERKDARQRAEKKPPDVYEVLDEVTNFAALARAGAYLAGDRRVSPKERTRWRLTFRRLAKDSQNALRGHDVKTAVRAFEELIDLACETKSFEFFRSEDPVEAASFVVSDAVAAIWARYRDQYGTDEMLQLAIGHLLRWESRFGWTRTGFGKVSEKETTLASLLVGYLSIPDLWTAAARHYLGALDTVEEHPPADRPFSGSIAKQRAEELSEWHQRLMEHLMGSEDEELLDRLVIHRALEGPELIFLQARLARERGDIKTASNLIQKSLKSLPGHLGFKRFAEELAELNEPS